MDDFEGLFDKLRHRQSDKFRRADRMCGDRFSGRDYWLPEQSDQLYGWKPNRLMTALKMRGAGHCWPALGLGGLNWRIARRAAGAAACSAQRSDGGGGTFVFRACRPGLQHLPCQGKRPRAKRKVQRGGKRASDSSWDRIGKL